MPLDSLIGVPLRGGILSVSGGGIFILMNSSFFKRSKRSMRS